MAQIPISSLICGGVRVDKIRGCTDIGQRIADALIKISSSRIFSIPEQSFLEIPVNSVDSYKEMSGKRTVGKFGMGFFSILYWLSENHSRYLLLTSRYNEKGEYFSYSVKIAWTNEGVILTPTQTPDELIVQKLSISSTPATTGTLLELIFEEAPLTKTNVNNIHHQLDRLFDVKDAIILVNNYPINNESSKNIVEVFVSSQYFYTIDNAKGIPWSTLLNTLLIPSYSSKTRIYIPEGPLSPEIRHSSDNEFIITISDIAVVTIKKPALKGYKFIVRMPTNTLLPVSRDNIIYERSSSEEKNLLHQLTLLADLAIRELNDVTIFLDLLNEYGEQTQNTILNSIIERIKLKIDMTDVIYVPKHEVFDILREMYPDIPFVSHPSPRLYITERRLRDLLTPNTNIFKLKNVVFLPITTIMETAGLSTFLFIQESYITTPNWIINLVSLSKNTLLIPLSVTSEIDFWKKIDMEITRRMLVDPMIHDSVIAFFLTLIAKTQNIQFNGMFKDEVNAYFLSIINQYFIIDQNNILEYLAYITSKFSKINFDFSYGTQPKIVIIKHQVLFNDLMFKGNTSTWHHTEFDTLLNEKLNNINIRLSYWYIDLWPILPKKYYHLAIHSNELFSDRFEFRSKPIIFRDELLKGLNKCLNESETLIFLNIMFLMKNIAVEGIGLFCLKEIRRRASPEELFEMTKSSLFDYDDAFILVDKIVIPLRSSLLLFSNIKNLDIQVPKYPTVGNEHVFTCKSLISYVFNVDDTFSNFDQSLVRIDQYERKFIPQNIKLQIVEIAINEGTTKEFVQAILTELTQNSIDAIRSQDLPGKIEIDITQEGISITDDVGIPDSSFTSLMIPFLSTKNPNDPNVTGEIGTGFFNVFRQPESQKVIIDTTLNKVQTLIEAVPLIRDGYVYDIRYTVKRLVNEEAPNYTKINVYFNFIHELMVQSIVDAQIYVKNYLGFTGIRTYLNGVLVVQKYKLITAHPLGKVFLTDDRNIPSFIMTNNIPFVSLLTFAKQFPGVYRQFLRDGSNRIIIDFNKRAYRPTQSRTKITIPERLERIITTFLNCALFLAILEAYSRKDFSYEDGIIPNSSSGMNIRQLKFNEQIVYPDFASSETSDFLYLYFDYSRTPDYKMNPSPFMKPTLALSINSYIDYFIKNKIVDPQISDSSTIMKAIKKWFDHKRFYEDKVLFGVGKPYFKHFKIIQPFVNLYWTLSDTKQTRSAPVILIGKLNQQLSGIYRSEEHTIIFNSDHFNENLIIERMLFIKTMYKSNKDEAIYLFRTDTILAELFAPNLPLTTLIHELLHAILNEDHKNSSHGVVRMVIKNRSELSFNEAGILLYQNILEKGIIDRFLTHDK